MAERQRRFSFFRRRNVEAEEKPQERVATSTPLRVAAGIPGTQRCSPRSFAYSEQLRSGLLTREECYNPKCNPRPNGIP